AATPAAAAPLAADPVALDYRAPDPSCIDAGRFADEVSAKLGFVPWGDESTNPRTIRIRVEREDEQFTGWFRNADGSAKSFEGATCGDVTANLVVTVAAALDRVPTAPPSNAPGNAVVYGELADRIPVTFRSVDGTAIDVAIKYGRAIGS